MLFAHIAFKSIPTVWAAVCKFVGTASFSTSRAADRRKKTSTFSATASILRNFSTTALAKKFCIRFFHTSFKTREFSAETTVALKAVIVSPVFTLTEAIFVPFVSEGMSKSGINSTVLPSKF